MAEVPFNKLYRAAATRLLAKVLPCLQKQKANKIYLWYLIRVVNSMPVQRVMKDVCAIGKNIIHKTGLVALPTASESLQSQ